MIKIWFGIIVLSAAFVLIGLVGIADVLICKDPDEWMSIGTFANSVIFLILSCLTYKALSK